MLLENKIVLISGGASGIGRELVKLLSQKNVIIFVDKDIKKSKSLIKTLNNDNVFFYKMDLSNEKSIKDTISQIKDKFKKIDVLINNAAMQRVGDFAETEFKDVIETNLLGTMILTKEILPNLKRGGTILNVLSVHAFVTRRHKISYDVSKAGLLMFTKELALELAPKKITVNGISIGAAKTSMNSDWLGIDTAVRSVTKKIPLGKIVLPNEVAHNIFVILENFSEVTTGSNFVIDQGRSLRG